MEEQLLLLAQYEAVRKRGEGRRHAVQGSGLKNQVTVSEDAFVGIGLDSRHVQLGVKHLGPVVDEIVLVVRGADLGNVGRGKS